MTSSYGWRIHPVTHEKQFHAGIDIAKPRGEPVLAPISGKIIEITKNHETKGNYVVLSAGTYKFEFFHLDLIKVNLNEEVSPGTILGTVGNTGRHTGGDASGYHLHYGVKKDNEYIDPLSIY